jgi:hypothetical protein
MKIPWRQTEPAARPCAFCESPEALGRQPENDTTTSQLGQGWE